MSQWNDSQWSPGASGPPPLPQGPPPQQPWDQGPAQQGWSAPDQPRPRARGRGKLLGGFVIGVVATVLVGTVLLLTKAITIGSTSHVSSAPVTLPDTLSGMRDAKAEIAAHPDLPKSLDRSGLIGTTGTPMPSAAELTRRIDTSTAEAVADFRHAYPGAGVGVRTYASAADKLAVTVIAIRAPLAPAITSSMVNLRDNDILFKHHTTSFGPVECVAANLDEMFGKPPDPAKEVISSCRRTDENLTVLIQTTGSYPEQRQLTVDMTNAAFEAVSAGS